MTCNNFAVRVGRGLAITGLVAGLLACGNSVSNGGNGNSGTIPVQPLAINVLSALVTPGYSLDGGAFDMSEYNDGNFILRSTASPGDLALLGSSHDANPAAVRVVQDTYDVLFQREHGSGVPQNVNTPVQTGEVVNVDRALPVAVTSWVVTPTFQQNSAAFPVTEYDNGAFYLQPSVGGERIFLGNSHTAMPDAVQVMEGTYDVIYSLETGGDLVPGNQSAVVDTLSINADVTPLINVASVRFQLVATLDGGAFSGSQYEYATLFLRNTTTNDLVELGASYDLPLTQMVADGTYDIVYQHVLGGQLPVNSDAVIAAGVIIGNSGVGSVTLDIPSVAITPAFTLDIGDGNGPLAFPASDYSDANFYLRSESNVNDVMFIGASELAPVAVRVISSTMSTGTGTLGAYEVLYRHETGVDVPQNANAVVKSNVVLNSDAALDVPVTSVDVTGTFRLNGSGFPDSASNSVQFLLRGDDADDEFLLGFSDINNVPVRLISISGSYENYDVIIDHLDGDAVPQNKMHVVAFNNLLDTSNASLLVGVTAKRVDANFTLDGAAFQTSIYQSARFYLRDITTNNRILLGNSYGNNSAVTVLNGTYDVIYEHRYGDEVPQNTYSTVGFVDVQ